jgi:hypothetical protein
MPQFVYGQDKTAWLQQMHAVLNTQFVQYERFQESHPDIGTLWDAPLYPLVDHHPMLTLLALARYLDIELDFSLCAAQQFCWSFKLASNAIENGARNAVTIPLILGNNNFAVPQNLTYGERIIHTHSLAAIGQRKAEGGRECHVCGLWETSPAPAVFCDGHEIEDFAGIKTGPGIGRGRYSVGNLCPDCIEMQTCAECGVFVCHNCQYPPAGPQNPLIAMENAEIRICCEGEGHSPECNDCGTSRGDLYFECHECEIQYCLRCEPPTGKVVVSDAWGGDVDLDEDLHLENGKRQPYSSKVLSGLVGYAPEHDPVDDDAYFTVVDMNMFETCASCDSTVCATCIKRANPGVASPSFLALKSTASLWKGCSTGCGKAYCEHCEANWLDPCCKHCKESQYMCTDCDTEDVPVYVHGCLEAGGKTRWCTEKDCMLNSGVLDFDDLKGPWEFDYVAPAPIPMPILHGPPPKMILAQLQGLYGPDTRQALKEMLKLTEQRTSATPGLPQGNKLTSALAFRSSGYDPRLPQNPGQSSALQFGNQPVPVVGYQPGSATGNSSAGYLAGPTPGHHQVAATGNHPGLVPGNFYLNSLPAPMTRFVPVYHQGPVPGYQQAPTYGYQPGPAAGSIPAGYHTGPTPGNHQVAHAGHHPGPIPGYFNPGGPLVPTAGMVPAHHQGLVPGHQVAPAFGYQPAPNHGTQQVLVPGNPPGSAVGSVSSVHRSNPFSFARGPPPGPGGAGGGPHQQQ